MEANPPNSVRVSNDSGAVEMDHDYPWGGVVELEDTDRAGRSSSPPLSSVEASRDVEFGAPLPTNEEG